MRTMTPEEVKRHTQDLPKYMPEELVREFMEFVGKFLLKWTENASKVVGGDDLEVPVGFFPLTAQAALVAAIAGIAKDVGHDPTAWVITLQEALSKCMMTYEGLDFAEYLRSDPVRHLAEVHGLLKE